MIAGFENNGTYLIFVFKEWTDGVSCLFAFGFLADPSACAI